MRYVEFEVNGIPVGKGRPRFVRRGNFVSTYTPDKTVAYEELVRISYKNTTAEYFDKDIPLRVTIHAYFPFPKSAPKKFQMLVKPPFMHKPDCDNLAKAILDALNGIAYHDDSQIVEVRVCKRYDILPRTEIMISEVAE